MAGPAWTNQAVSLIVLIEEVSGFSGLFGYSPTVGAGNLVFSLAAAPGTDPYGNHYDGPGLAVYGAANQEVFVSVANALAQAFFKSGAAIENNVAGIFADQNAGPPPFVQMFINGPSITLSGHKDFIGIVLNSANNAGTSFANLEFIYNDTSGATHEFAFMDARGFIVPIGVIRAPDGTHTATAASPAIGESWHDLAPLQNGFSVGAQVGSGIVDDPKIALMADSNMVALKGSVTTPAAGTINGTVWAQVPGAAYNPNMGGLFTVVKALQNSGGNAGFTVIRNNGNIEFFGGFGNNVTVNIDGVGFLDDPFQ